MSMAVPCVLLLSLAVAYVAGNASESSANEDESSRLLVVWTSGDRDVALKMVFMYVYNAKLNGWWDEVQLLVWGPSSKLLSVDEEVQEYIAKMKDEGVELNACKACADQYGVSDRLTALGFDVKYMGEPLTAMLKDGWTTVTF
jgi:hypothetical protein